MEPKQQFSIWYFLVAFLLIVALQELVFTAVRVADPNLVQDLEAAKVPFAGQVESKWLSTLLSWIVLAVVFFLIWGYAMKLMGGAAGVNRAVFGSLGISGYARFLRRATGSIDSRRFLHRYYAPSWHKSLLYPWAWWRARSRRRDVTCSHVDCTCVWCRCGSSGLEEGAL